MASCAQQEALVGLPRAQRALLAANTWHAGYLLAFYRFLVVKRPHITPPPSAKILGLPDSHMTARLSSEVGVAESGVAESGGRDANGAAEAQRAADLIATLGAQNKAQREQIAALKAAITSLQQEFKAAEQVHEAAKASKNAELLDFMKAHAREQQTKQTVAQLRQANAAKWEQVKEEQAKLAVLGLQSAKLALEEAQAAERRRAHAATVEVVRQRAELAEAVLAEEVSAAAARLAEHDRRAAEVQQAEAAERARVAEAAEAAKAAEAAEAAKAAEAAEAAKAAEQAEAAERARRAEAPVIELLRGGALLFDTIQASVGGSPEALAAVLDTLQARRPMAALRYLVAHCSCNHACVPQIWRVASGQLRRVPQHLRLLPAALVHETDGPRRRRPTGHLNATVPLTVVRDLHRSTDMQHLALRSSPSAPRVP